mmetsp:Transcript_41673/g.61172  ORF Transcript_41673/g.61172 Transcript_41673/m.61172 type:complete len:376 (-) Transcript_41673:78-1205(-)
MATQAQLLSCVVKIVNTTKYNGSVGLCVSHNVERDRYTIKLDETTSVSIKSENLEAAGTLDKVKYRGQEAIGKARSVIHDPMLQRQAMSYYTSMKQKMPSYLPPERAAVVLLGILFLGIRAVGFSKFLLLLSIASMPIAISLSDIVQNGITDPKILAKNFPRNLKQSIVQATGGYGAGVSENILMAGFVVFLGVSVKVLLSPATIGSAAGAGAAVSDMNTNTAASGSGETEQLAATTALNIKAKLEQIYKLGFQDSANELEYGASLTDSLLEETMETIKPAKRAMGVVNNGASDDIDWAYDVPPPRSTSTGGFMKKLGFGTMMSGMHLFRTLYQLGRTPDGRVDPQLLVANLKNLEPWRLGLLALVAYKVLSVFM